MSNPRDQDPRDRRAVALALFPLPIPPFLSLAFPLPSFSFPLPIPHFLMCRPSANTETSRRTREKPLVPRVVEAKNVTEFRKKK